jgi:tRNA U38,U39,U40 pseudouridine synthase TruA
MVRKLVACLVEVGRGNMKAEDVERMIAKPREPFSPTAPPSGLFLEGVVYPNEKFTRPLVPVVAVSTFLPQGRR